VYQQDVGQPAAPPLTSIGGSRRFCNVGALPEFVSQKEHMILTPGTLNYADGESDNSTKAN